MKSLVLTGVMTLGLGFTSAQAAQPECETNTQSVVFKKKEITEESPLAIKKIEVTNYEQLLRELHQSKKRDDERRLAEQEKLREEVRKQRLAEEQRQKELAEKRAQQLAEIEAERKRVAEQERQAELARITEQNRLAEQRRKDEQERQVEIQRQAELRQSDHVKQTPSPQEPQEEINQPVIQTEKVERPQVAQERPQEPQPTSVQGSKSIEFTYYTATCAGCSGVTATGIDVRSTTQYNGMYVIAVDPGVIPLWSIVQFEYNGSMVKAIALDTGGAIKGNRIDMLVGSESQAQSLGRGTKNIQILRYGK